MPWHQPPPSSSMQTKCYRNAALSPNSCLFIIFFTRPTCVHTLPLHRHDIRLQHVCNIVAVTKMSRKRLVGSEVGKFRYLPRVSLKRPQYFPFFFFALLLRIFLVEGEKGTRGTRERDREREGERGIACAGRRHSNHVSVFFSVAGAAHRDRGKKRTRTLNQS